MIILRSHDQRTQDYFLGIDRDWIECKDRQLWVEIGFLCLSTESESLFTSLNSLSLEIFNRLPLLRTGATWDLSDNMTIMISKATLSL
jgi:hypothetical protein